MKKLYFLLLLLTGFVNGQIVNIPDANFKARLIAVGVDTNADGEIQVSEAQARTSLNIPEGGITSFSGIESFTNLTYLNCSNQRATSLNVSGMPNLAYLDCSYNYYLASLNLGSISALTYLDCSHNSLYTLNVSGLINLTQLKAWGNGLSVLDVGSLVNLTYLDCNENLYLSSLDVSNLTNLTYLACGSNNISVLDVANLTNLTILYCGGNNISNLDVSQLTHLNRLFCNNNQIASLNLTQLTELDFLFCNDNPIPNLDLSTLTNLTRLNCGSPQLVSLDLSNNPNITGLSINGGQFTSVDLSHLPNLQALTVWNSAMTSLDVSTCHLLTELRFISPTNLHYLNLKNGGAIGTIYLTSTSNIMNICCNEGDLANINQQMAYTNTANIFTANSNCLFFPMGEYNTITGNVHLDSNNDGCDADDILQPGIKMKLTNGTNQGVTFTNAAGHYEFFPQTGNFTVAPGFENADFFTFSPTSSTVNFANNDGNIATGDFCVIPNGIHNDVEVVMAPLGRARPGFDAYYKIVYKNKGNQPISGDIQMTFQDELMDYVSSSIALSSQDAGVLNWTYDNLLPFESRSFTVIMNVNSPVEAPPVNVGDELSFGTVINPIDGDEHPLDNIAGFKQTVVGSIDPNDKTCLEGNTVSTSKIGDYLHYNINFGNTGTSEAEKIVVKDVIDKTKFDINTLQIMDSSHPVIVRMANNQVDFIFDNINLGTLQHGNVLFKIKTKSTLAVGSTVTNKADIYFDYNASVATNTFSTTFQTLGINENQIDNSIVVFPNPALNTISIKANNTIKSVQLFDVQGRILTTKLDEENQVNVDLSGYSNGIYFLKISTENGGKVERFVKQ